MKKFISLLLCTASIVPANAGQGDVMFASEPHHLPVRSRLNSVNCGSSAVNLQREALEAYALQRHKSEAEAIQAQKVALDAFTAQKRKGEAEAIQAQKVALDAFAAQKRKAEAEVIQAQKAALDAFAAQKRKGEAEAIQAQKAALEAYAPHKEEQELKQAIQNSLATQKEQELRTVVNKFAEEYELKQVIQNSLSTHKEEQELKQAIQNSLATQKEQDIRNAVNNFVENYELEQAILESLKTSRIQKVTLKATDLVQGKLNLQPEVTLKATDLVQGKLLIEDEDALQAQLDAAQQELKDLEVEVELDQLIAEHGADLTDDEEVVSPLGRDVTTDDLQALLHTLSPSQANNTQPQPVVVDIDAQEAALRAQLNAAKQALKALEAKGEPDYGADLTADDEDAEEEAMLAELAELQKGLNAVQNPQPQPAVVKLGEAELAKGTLKIQTLAPIPQPQLAPAAAVKSNAVFYKSGKSKRQAELDALNAGSLLEKPTTEVALARATTPAPVSTVKTSVVSYKFGKNKVQAELEALNAGSTSPLFEEVKEEDAPKVVREVSPQVQAKTPAPVSTVKTNVVSYKSGKNKVQAELEALNAGSTRPLFVEPTEADLVAVDKVVQTAALLPLEEALLEDKSSEARLAAAPKIAYTPNPLAYEKALRFAGKSATEKMDQKRLAIDPATLAAKMNSLRPVDTEKKTTYKPVEQKVFEDIKNIGKMSLRPVQDRTLPANPLKPKAKKVLSQEELIDRALHSIILKRDLSMRQGADRAELLQDITTTIGGIQELLGISGEQVEDMLKEKRWEINNGKKALKQ